MTDDSVRALSSLPVIDYADRFSLGTDVDATPEQWARAMFGNEPGLGEIFIWRVILGLRLSRGRSPSTVAGWRIGGRGDDWIRLEAASWFLTANLVVGTTGAEVSLVTFVHYARLPGRALWPPLSAVHRFLVPGVLRAAGARMSAPAAAAAGPRQRGQRPT
jgi:hypothetical protein